VTRLPRPDFLARAPQPGVLAWAAAGTGALVLALAVADVLSLQRRIADQQVQLETQLAAADATARITPTRAPRTPTATVADTRAADAEARVLRRLGYPWQQLFTTLEEATPAGVQWLALDHTSDHTNDRTSGQTSGPASDRTSDRTSNPSTDRADLRLAGQARDAAQAVALVDALSAWAGWSAVVLRKLAPSDARGGAAGNVPGPSGTPTLFEIEAQFDAPGRRAVPAAAPAPQAARAP